MFGYVIVNKPELKIKDFDFYQSFYCGLCETLKQHYGRFGQASLNFDMTFLILVLSGLYESKITETSSRCIIHPVRQHMARTSEFSKYGADMTIVLTYLKCKDDWQDEHKQSSHILQSALKKKYEALRNVYPEKIKRIEAALQENDELEQQGCTDLDILASKTGAFMGEIFCVKEDEWHDSLFTFGDYLGRFIYLMDAYDDLQEDLKEGRFNPFIRYVTREDFDDWVKEILELMMATSAAAFERLPILLYTDMIRNIIYSGVWAKYDAVRKKRTGDKDE